VTRLADFVAEVGDLDGEDCLGFLEAPPYFAPWGGAGLLLLARRTDATH
jgi:hypothetical protein